MSNTTDYAQALEQRGGELYAQGSYAEAEAVFREVAGMRPHSAIAWSNLGAALDELRRAEESLACFHRAVELDPNNVMARLNLANLYAKLGRAQEATETLRAAQAQLPGNASVHYRAGRMYYGQGLRAEALAAFARALDLDPGFAQARWMAAIAALPLTYGHGEDPEQAVLEFETALAALEEWFDESRSALGPRAVGEGQPFFLAFHERDNKPLLMRYGDLCERLMRPLAPTLAPTPHVAATGPVRVAIVSGHLFDQSVWTALVKGWCLNFDPDAVEVHFFYPGATVDAETQIARARGASFHMGLGDVRRWVEAIRRLEPDVVLYPEIGMHADCARLAAIRLAPVQAVSWGHPETSGLPTIDYFLSAVAFEPPGAAANYRERLVALPGVGCYYDALTPDFTGVDWEALGLDPFVPRLLCAGAPHKYMPAYDALLVDIARRVGECHFVFFVDPSPFLSRQVKERIDVAFRAAGLDPSRFVKLVPHQARPAFFGMMRDCDVLLDTIGFSGFNTTMQAIECDLPVVAWEGKFLRGRLASGTLRAMGMDELVARSPQEYADIAARLCRDATYRLKVAAKLAHQRRPILRDLAPVRALEDFLRSVR